MTAAEGVATARLRAATGVLVAIADSKRFGLELLSLLVQQQMREEVATTRL